MIKSGYSIIFSNDVLSKKELQDRTRWVKENIQGEYWINKQMKQHSFRIFCFEDDSDAMLFKLTWC